MTRRLSVEGLHVSYSQRGEMQEAVRDVSFAVEPGEILGIVGESGSGKSSLAQAILRLLPPSVSLRGSIWLGDKDLLRLTESQMVSIRGRSIGMIFQDPASALNPVLTISTQIVDTLRRHRGDLSKREARKIAGETLESMGIKAARLDSYPHELSGGMRQRALIAAAMAAEPEFLVADEPTSDLDTINQSQIIDLIRRLSRERGIGVILISHDIGVVASICDMVAVMRSAELIEIGSTATVLQAPKHPYTANFLRVSARERNQDGTFITMPESDEARGHGDVVLGTRQGT